MVCATPAMIQDIKSPIQLEEDSETDEELLSQDDSSASNSPSSTAKRPQALFLNFTSDLSPQKMNKKKAKPKRQTAYRVNGVNILNRNNLDSKTAIERIQKRRENHNHVERRRRDNINNTIYELSSVVPNAAQPGQKPNKGNILKLSLDYIKELQAENNALKERLNSVPPTPTSPHYHLPVVEEAPAVLPSFYIPQPPHPLSRHPSHPHPPLRPLLPASPLPSIRMSGYEKIYGNVCRY
ncbi:Myc-type, basic helix-loop-helix domain-containing protein [Sporodiniella umbellata]|nr:Myc-type, basic helix-loop-helix domain-containing protein [Sporodiniella umbellata]